MPAPERSDGRARRLAGPADLTTPFIRAREFLGRRSRESDHPAELPIARPSVAVARQVFFDEVVLLGLRMFLPVGEPHASSVRSKQRWSTTTSGAGWGIRRVSSPLRHH